MIKKTALTFFLLMAAHAYAANWSLVGESNTDHYYIDKDSIVEKGQEKKVWILSDLKKPDVIDKKTVRSLKIQEIYLCGQKKRGIASVEFYSGKKATGKVVTSHNLASPEFKDVISGSIAETKYKAVCGQDK